MSQPCAITNCKRASRALCYCCRQNVCIIHLNEHNDLLNSQLNPLADEINVLGERLKSFNIHDILSDCRQKLEQWRLDCHQTIDHFVEQKYQELDRLIIKKLDEQRENINHIRSKVAELIRDQEATRQDIDILTSTIRQLKNETNEIEETFFRISTRSLTIDDNLLQVHEIRKKELTLSTFSFIYKTLQSPPESRRSLASNDRLLLIHQTPDLCLVDREMNIVKQVLWSRGKINDMCWLSILDRFIVLEENNILLVDEKSMSVESIQTMEKREWLSCACSNTSLFLTATECGSTIVEFRLLPSIAIIKEWKSPNTCAKDEFIDDIVYNDGTLALMIRNRIKKSMHIELRSSNTLNRIWSLPLDIAYNRIAFRCCSLNCNEWLVVDYESKRLLHITSDGKIKTIIPYEAIPYRVSLFGPNMIAVATKNEINLHKIL